MKAPQVEFMLEESVGAAPMRIRHRPPPPPTLRLSAAALHRRQLVHQRVQHDLLGASVAKCSTSAEEAMACAAADSTVAEAAEEPAASTVVPAAAGSKVATVTTSLVTPSKVTQASNKTTTNANSDSLSVRKTESCWLTPIYKGSR